MQLNDDLLRSIYDIFCVEKVEEKEDVDNMMNEVNIAIYQQVVYGNNKPILKLRKSSSLEKVKMNNENEVNHEIKLKKIQLNYPVVLTSDNMKIEQYITKYSALFNEIKRTMNYDYLSNKLYLQKIVSM